MKIKGVPIRKIIARLNYQIEQWEALRSYLGKLDPFGNDLLCNSKQEKEYLELLQLTEEKRRLLTRVTELLLAVLAEDNDNNRKITFADKLSLKQLPDMVNSANAMRQLANIEELIEANKEYIRNLLK